MRNSDDDRYLWFDTTNGMMQAAKRSGEPLIGTFELTARCNLACKMCYIRRDAGNQQVILQEKSAKQWISLGEQAAKAGTLFLLLTGGEPLIRPDFKEIYEAFTQMGFIITLYTNATLVTAEFAEWIAKIPPNKVEITLYGASPETYAAVTGSANAFEKTLRGIDLLIEAGLKITLRTTIIHKNMNDIAAMNIIAKDRNLKMENTLSVIKPVRGAISNTEAERLSPLEIKNLELEEISSDEECEPTYKSRALKVTVSKEPMFCSAGKCSYWVAWDGRMLPCAMMDKPYSLPFCSSFEMAWEKLKLGILDITSPEECGVCQYKPYCSVCPAKLQAETGSFNELSQYVCEMAHMVFDKQAKI